MIVFLISVYQKIVSPALKQLLGIQSMCRFTPSCSEYAKVSIRKYGTIKGVYLSLVRLLQCQPFQSQNSNVKMQIYISKLKAFKVLRFAM